MNSSKERYGHSLGFPLPVVQDDTSFNSLVSKTRFVLQLNREEWALYLYESTLLCRRRYREARVGHPIQLCDRFHRQARQPL